MGVLAGTFCGVFARIVIIHSEPTRSLRFLYVKVIVSVTLCCVVALLELPLISSPANWCSKIKRPMSTPTQWHPPHTLARRIWMECDIFTVGASPPQTFAKNRKKKGLAGD